MKKVSAAFALVCLLSALVCAQQKTIRDLAEYNAYISALNQQDPAAKAAAMEEFVAQYPNSVVKVDALEQAMAAYQQTGKTAEVEATAVRILQIEPTNVRALAIAAYLKRAAATAKGDPKMAEEAGKFAQDGLASLSVWRRPEGISDEDFAKLHKQMNAIFYGVAGFSDLQARAFAAARASYLQSLAIDPSNMQDTYQLAIAELRMTPLDVNGFWYAAKAISLALNQNNPTAADTVAGYAKAVYRQYHGFDDDWDLLVKAAASQNEPPPDFASSIRIRREVADLACKALAESDPDSLSFSDWEFVLALRDEGPCNRDAAEKVWTAIWRREEEGQAKLRFPIKVISASNRHIETAITDENQATNTVDLKIEMEEPLPKPPEAGANIEIIGVITGYTTKPFMFLMEKGELARK